jgi:hypothetical protein
MAGAPEIRLRYSEWQVEYTEALLEADPSKLLVACRRDNVSADAAGRIGIFPLDLPELLHDAADSG